MQGALAGSLTVSSCSAVAPRRGIEDPLLEVSSKGHGSRVVMSVSMGRRPLRGREISGPEEAIPRPLPSSSMDKFHWKSLEAPSDPLPTVTADCGFLQRLSIAWNMLFPRPAARNVAQIAKMRLKMVLNNDRLQVSPHLKHGLCDNIVETMSDFVIVNKDAEVQFAVHRAPESGSVYLIKVPVARVKPHYQIQMQPIVDAIEQRRLNM